MQLFTSPTTPFGRKIAVQILESGLSGRVTLTEVAGSPFNPGNLPVDRNPLGKIPALVTDTGQAIYDSRVISRYLDEQSGAGLYPKDEALWPALVLEATADGILDAAVLMAYEMRLRPAEMCYAPWLEAQWAKIARTLDSIEVDGLAQLWGPLSMAQIAIGCGLEYLDLRHDGRNWRKGRSGLAAWAKGFSARSSMLATVSRP
jgi:glutathione S-transferase